MTKAEIVEMLDAITAGSKHPIVAFSVRDWDYNGQIQVEAMFQVHAPKSYAIGQEPSK